MTATTDVAPGAFALQPPPPRQGNAARTGEARPRAWSRVRTSEGEMAAAIGWLLSDSARALTGEAINVAAGQTMV